MLTWLLRADRHWCSGHTVPSVVACDPVVSVRGERAGACQTSRVVGHVQVGHTDRRAGIGEHTLSVTYHDAAFSVQLGRPGAGVGVQAVVGIPGREGIADRDPTP